MGTGYATWQVSARQIQRCYLIRVAEQNLIGCCRGMLYGKGGELFDGDWANNQRHGEGKQVYENGDAYEGSWTDGKREGYGRLTKVTHPLSESRLASQPHPEWRCIGSM